MGGALSNTYRFSEKKITKIEINPSGKMADVDKKNNIIKF